MTFRIRRLLTTSVALGALIATPVLAAEDGLAGPYLAARQASFLSDYSEAAKYYDKALKNDASNLVLLENALIAFLGKGDMAGAKRVAEMYVKIGGVDQAVNTVLNTAAMSAGEYDVVLNSTDGSAGLAPLIGGLLKAWATVGKGDMSGALDRLSTLAEIDDFADFAHYNQALAHAMVGDFEAADSIMSGVKFGPLSVNLRAIEAHAQVLVQLERRDDAIILLEETLNGAFRPDQSALLERLKSGEPVSYDFVTTAQDGAAEVFFELASLLADRTAPQHVLTYARMSTHLRPDHAPATLMIARILEDLDQYDLATEAYGMVSADHPSYLSAEMGRANTLFAEDRKDAAIEVLTALSKTHSDVALVHAALGDTLSRVENYSAAVVAYGRAIDLQGPENDNVWPVFYARGIAQERQGNFAEMEADFRKALSLSPDVQKPNVLNYLGYSLVEQQIKMDEALGMIETAVKQNPNSGYITDSLAWVFYRFGRYEEAVAPMEKAVSLLPVDPIVNDHLGDVYWKVGRLREAEFQWKRALSFEPEDGEADRIRRKLEVGLDAVLAEEDVAQPTQTAEE